MEKEKLKKMVDSIQAAFLQILSHAEALLW